MAAPYSVVDPTSLGIFQVTRGSIQSPMHDRFAAGLLPDGGEGAVAVPTNAWWDNFQLGRGPEEGADGNVFAIPYVLWGTENGLAASMPFVLSAADHVENAFDSNVLSVRLGAENLVGGQRVSAHDAMSVTLAWGEKGHKHGFATSPVVRGSPYITMEYEVAVPMFSSAMTLDPQQGLKVDGTRRQCAGKLHGSKFEFVFVQSDETWTLWASRPLLVACETRGHLTMRSINTFTGVVRAAMTNNCTFGRSAHHCSRSPPAPPEPGFGEMFDKHHEVFPVGATIDLTSQGDNAYVSVLWEVRRMPGGGSSEARLLMSAMEHHRRLGLCGDTGEGLEMDSRVFQRNINGALTLATGETWLLPYALLPVSWSSLHGVTPRLREAVSDALRADADWDVPANYRTGAGDPYNAGKLLARLATLALVAQELGEEDIRDRIVGRLTKLVELYASGNGKNRFVYDGSWGGFVSCGCAYDVVDGVPTCKNRGPSTSADGSSDCPALTDPGMDFGNGFYNDHHFQWGYHIYAAAVAARLDPAWALRNKENLLLYARDVANPDAADRYFPVWRHKDWYTGWSWASGIALGGGRPYRNGRNQESTSEAINGYYGVQLLGDALGMASMRDWGRAALASEIVSTQIYWQIGADSVYPEDFRTNPVVGILWQNLAQYQTWFGGAPYMINGIQMLPFIPVSEFYLQPEWVNRSQNIGAESCKASPGCTNDGWSSLFVMEAAISDPHKAWAEAQTLPAQAFDGPAGNGISRTAVMFWIATRPQMQSEEAGPVPWPRWLGCHAVAGVAYSHGASAKEVGPTSVLEQSHDVPLLMWLVIISLGVALFAVACLVTSQLRRSARKGGWGLLDRESSGSELEQGFSSSSNAE